MVDKVQRYCGDLGNAYTGYTIPFHTKFLIRGSMQDGLMSLSLNLGLQATPSFILPTLGEIVMTVLMVLPLILQTILM